MKGVIYYYSGAGNTKLACRYIAGNVAIPFDLVDVVKEKQIDLEPYDVVGFATFTDFLGPPHLFQAFVEGLPRQEGKLAFVFNTYGARSGRTLRILEKRGAAKGFVVIAGHSLHTPECYPPMIARGELTLFVNLGDHEENWDWLKGELGPAATSLTLHRSWEDARAYADGIREGEASGLHVFLFDNTFHGVYATNYLMRVTDVMITKPSELAFYPIPKIFNERVGAHEAWGAIRSAELGDGTIETRSIPRTLQAIDLLAKETDLLEMYCDSIVKNKRSGIYDGAYKCVALATGTTFERTDDGISFGPSS